MTKKLTQREIAAVNAHIVALDEGLFEYARRCGVSFNTLKKALAGQRIQLAKRDAIVQYSTRRRRIWPRLLQPGAGGRGRPVHPADRPLVANAGLDRQQLDCFRWKDYRVRDKTKIMSLDVDEFIRRFLLHILPDQFRRIRHFGFLANACRTAKLARIRGALALPEPPPVAEPTDYRVRYALLIGQRIDLCPCCGGRMVEVGFTARMPRNSSPYRHPRCDTS